MITLTARGVARGVSRNLVGRVSLRALPLSARQDVVRVLSDGATEELDGYLAAVTSEASEGGLGGVPHVLQCQTSHLAEGDVVSIATSGHVRTLYRRASPHNTLFATERCNSLCLMCSQPPRDVDDSWRVDEMMRVVRLMDPETREVGISGGEPTLLGDGLLRVVSACKEHLPQTSVHVLSNGRRFLYASYARALGAVEHPNLMIGVPVYSDLDSQHDYVVQARGAFNETMIGLHNLARFDVPVEIRIVVHRDTYRRLSQLAQFIYRNLTFASHVAFMGLEVIGFAKANFAALWIDPVDYQTELMSAVEFLDGVGMNVSIYNHQLCTIPRSLWPHARRSISDWKREYAPECERCGVRDDCGGFFAWNVTAGKSRGIQAMTA